MARYRVLLDNGAYINPQNLMAEGPQEVRKVKQGEFQRRGVGPALDEEMLADLLADKVTALSDRPPAESDPKIAMAVHGALNFSRRDASDQDLWTFLNITAGWPYVAWRWSRNGAVGRDRVAGGLDRSALARLWWMAELVEGPDTDEERKRLDTLLSKQDLAVSLYERPRLFRRPGLPKQLISAVGDKSRAWTESRFRRFAQTCRSYFGVRLTAAYSKEQLESDVAELAKRVVES